MLPDIIALSRRAFVTLGAVLGIGEASRRVTSIAWSETPADYQPKTLTVAELATLKGIMSRLIPRDGAEGGAVEAQAFVYVDGALAGYHTRHREAYRSGLGELDRCARQAGVANFPALSSSAMDWLITQMERGELNGGAFPDGGRAFFNLVRRHTVEGMFCDPMYGGNKDFLGWKILGCNGVQLNYPAEAQALNGKDDRPQRSIADFGGSPMA